MFGGANTGGNTISLKTYPCLEYSRSIGQVSRGIKARMTWASMGGYAWSVGGIF